MVILGEPHGREGGGGPIGGLNEEGDLISLIPKCDMFLESPHLPRDKLVQMGSKGSSRVQNGPKGSQWVPMGPNWSKMIRYGPN